MLGNKFYKAKLVTRAYTEWVKGNNNNDNRGSIAMAILNFGIFTSGV